MLLFSNRFGFNVLIAVKLYNYNIEILDSNPNDVIFLVYHFINIDNRADIL